MHKPTFYILDVLSDGFSKLKKNFFPLLLWNLIIYIVIVIFFGVYIAHYEGFSDILRTNIMNEKSFFENIKNFENHFIISILIAFLLWDLFFSQISVKISKAEKLSFYDLKPSIKHLANSIFTIICFWGILFLSEFLLLHFKAKILNSSQENPQAVVSLVSFIFFVIQALLYTKLFLAPYISIDKNHFVLKAFKESIQLSSFWKLFGFNILQNLFIALSSMILAYITVFLTENILLGMFVFVLFMVCIAKPFTVINNANIYQQLYGFYHDEQSSIDLNK